MASVLLSLPQLGMAAMDALLSAYLTRNQLAAELNVTTRTVARWQAQPDGLPFTMLGSRTLYKRASVLAWIESHERQPNPRRRAT
jgi:excisionase family DNA binding protein